MLHSRNKRVEEAIREALSTIFQLELKDPRLPAILTVTRVQLAKDSRNATVYFSQMPDDAASVEQTLEALGHSRGFLRSQLAHELNMKHTPEIHFRYDPSEKEYHRINAVIQDLKAKGQMPAADGDRQDGE
jgi:ribosome-binding factor A